MAILMSTGAGLSFNVSTIKPVDRCSVTPDLIFDLKTLWLPAYGIGWPAVSGPWGKGALPFGWYRCGNLRTRNQANMTREGVSFSVDLTPLFPTDRTDLRIHPDGNVPGTLGCIGITADVKECYEALKRLIPPPHGTCSLQVKLPS